jgi:hypothetical protein
MLIMRNKDTILLEQAYDVTSRLQEVKQSINGYVQRRENPGSFLTAVLSNDLFEAIGRADENSLASLKGIVGYIYNELPGDVWGSREKVKRHLSGSNNS